MEIFRQIGDRHSDSVAPTCAVLLTQVVRWRALQGGTSWTRTTSTRRQARNSSEPLDLEHALQGNWHDLNEFFEYATEWEPSASLYFGDNILQVRDNKISSPFYQVKITFLRIFWLRTSSPKTVIAWLAPGPLGCLLEFQNFTPEQ